MKKEYLLIVSKKGPQLADLLATAGIDVPPQPDRRCLRFGEREIDVRERFTKAEAWILTGWMDPARAAQLDGFRGIVAWRPIERSDPGTDAPSREVVLTSEDGRWMDVLATLVGKGFRPLEGDPAVVRMYGEASFLSGWTSLSLAELEDIDGVESAIEVEHIDFVQAAEPTEPPPDSQAP